MNEQQKLQLLQESIPTIEPLQSLTFSYNYNQPLSPGVLPTSLQSLVFGDRYNQPLSVGVLPSSLQSLVFGYYYDQPLSIGVLPSSLQSLVFGGYENQLSVGVLPSSLQSLVFGYHYNQPLSICVLPSSLQSLEFGDEYNQRLESIQKIYYPSSDIYSVGSTLFHLLSCHPDDIGNRKEFVKNHKENNFGAGHIKISTIRYSEHLINFVKKLLIEKHQDRLSLGHLNGKKIRQHTQRFTSFFIDQRQILSSTTTLILDENFSLPESLEILVLGKSFNQPLHSYVALDPMILYRSTIHLIRDNFSDSMISNLYHFYERNLNIYYCSVHDNNIIAYSFLKENMKIDSFILTVGQECFGIGQIKGDNNMIQWKNNDISISIDLMDFGVISHVKQSIHPHLFCQVDKN
ncbi:hypothetical protein DFA_06952 [Cavenderia fasciculata]|uniref:Protein kinase domain-containing protein n=1 Tax=Cavenderia fasciculata TaxID=261658 RepID=F4PX46_CACFS|nr:uncharacterized protein DFA_06952 [Cavenderia fasciculata]EGG19849.1 hypothetical protein DFA_06952 [Cavenderia fasciculata]|eukprot:XP_004358195.1 hypothetical protein DFA_06952 [Cavenderia fasciculata]